jgi:hypothetical protein
MTDPSIEVMNEELRWARAAAWARSQSLGPWGRGLDERECRRIEALRDCIVAAGDDTDEQAAAFAAWERAQGLDAFDWTSIGAAELDEREVAWDDDEKEAR